MPGRQSTGPAPLLRSRPQKKKRKRALDAFALAEEEESGNARIRLSRLGHLEDNAGSNDDRASSDNEDGDGSDDKRKSKRLRHGKRDADGTKIEGGSDSEGNEWITGRIHSDDDSSIDSDEAMGSSDEGRFDGFTFGGSSSSKERTRKRRLEQGKNEIDLDEEELSSASSDAESEGFAAEAMELAQVFDQRDSASESDVAGDEDEESVSQLSFSEEEQDDRQASQGISGLQRFVNSLDEGKKAETSKFTTDAHEGMIPSAEGFTSKTRLTLSDMLDKSSDPSVRKQLRSKKGKLAVPLAKRQQDRVDRAAAYDQSKETLGRWVETVKQNRRAEHLEFPLPDPSAAAAKSNLHMSVDSTTKPINGLDLAIQKILEESGMGGEDGKSPDEQVREFEELAANKMPIEEVRARRAQLRRARELLFREEIKAKRIKKIKSKSWRRVHRKERERDAQREREMMAEAGIEPDEDETERLQRLRAEERISGKHRASRWAKGVKATRRGVWDEDARAGMHEMARREEELKKRIEGRDPDADSLNGSDSDSDDESSEDENNAQGRRLRKLHDLQRSDGEQTNGLHSLAFMQKAEAARKARNEEDVEQLRRELVGEQVPSEESDDDAPIGRRIFGPQTTESAVDTPAEARGEFEERQDSDDPDREFAATKVSIVTDRPAAKQTPRTEKRSKAFASQTPQLPASQDEDTIEDNPWLSVPKKSRSKATTVGADVHISTSTQLPVQSQRMSHTPNPQPSAASDSSQSKLPAPSDFQTIQFQPADEHSDSEPTTPPPTNEALIRQAFAADDVLAAEGFAAEKAALEEEEAAGEVKEERMPGWGSWVGEGLPVTSKAKLSRSKQPDSRSQALTPAAINRLGSSFAAATANAALPGAASNPRVMVSSKTVKANAPYRATQLPHPFETRAQYERALRLPVGPEWVTRHTFLDGTKPRVNVKKGEVIRAMRKPLA